MNLYNYLKDCPQNTLLFSLVHGFVLYQKCILEDHGVEIVVKIITELDERLVKFSSDGKLKAGFYGECILFPVNCSWLEFSKERVIHCDKITSLNWRKLNNSIRISNYGKINVTSNENITKYIDD